MRDRKCEHINIHSDVYSNLELMYCVEGDRTIFNMNGNNLMDIDSSVKDSIADQLKNRKRL